MTDLIHRARVFAIQKQERIDQRRASARKAPDAHLKAVADMVAQTTDEVEVIAAAWLHEVVEDTPATFEAVEREFGRRVAQLVEEVTDAGRPTQGTFSRRLSADRTHAEKASAAAKSIKLADLIDTCSDVCTKSPDLAGPYLTRAAALLTVLGDGDSKLFARARKTIQQWSGRLGVKMSESDHPPLGITEPGPSFDLIATHWQKLFIKAFTGAEIGEALHSFDLGTPIETLESAIERTDEEVVGIRQDGRVVGYLDREDLSRGVSTEGFRPFVEGQVLDGSAPLADVIYVLTRHDYCFISLFDSVIGVISRSDIQKPVVRMWLFGMITFFELYLNERVDKVWPENSWENQVSSVRLERARALFDERKRRHLSGTLLECLQFSDKMQLLLQNPAERAEFGFKTKGAADRVVKDLESLRNNLAHSQDIVSNDWPQIARLAFRMLMSSDDL